jgi:hypothetical protein
MTQLLQRKARGMGSDENIQNREDRPLRMVSPNAEGSTPDREFVQPPHLRIVTVSMKGSFVAEVMCAEGEDFRAALAASACDTVTDIIDQAEETEVRFRFEGEPKSSS